MIVYHTKSYRNIARLIREHVANVRIDEGKIEIKTFPDGEVYHHILDNVEDQDILLVGGTIDDSETLEIFDIACHVVKHGAKSLTIVIPYFGYSTMERSVKDGEIVKAKTRARLLSAIPSASTRNRVVFIDLHSEGIPHYFEGGIQPIHIYGKPIVIETCNELVPSKDFVIASTDAGRAKWVESLAKDMGVNCAVITKRRLSGSETQVAGVNADVKGKSVIIYDDMIRTGGSLIEAGKTYLEAGASEVFAIATHGVMPEGTVKKLHESGVFKKIVVTDTHPGAYNHPGNYTAGKSPFLIVKPVAGLIAKKLFDI